MFTVLTVINVTPLFENFLFCLVKKNNTMSCMTFNKNCIYKDFTSIFPEKEMLRESGL